MAVFAYAYPKYQSNSKAALFSASTRALATRVIRLLTPHTVTGGVAVRELSRVAPRMPIT